MAPGAKGQPPSPPMELSNLRMPHSMATQVRVSPMARVSWKWPASRSGP